MNLTIELSDGIQNLVRRGPLAPEKTGIYFLTDYATVQVAVTDHDETVNGWLDSPMMHRGLIVTLCILAVNLILIFGATIHRALKARKKQVEAVARFVMSSDTEVIHEGGSYDLKESNGQSNKFALLNPSD